MKRTLLHRGSCCLLKFSGGGGGAFSNVAMFFVKFQHQNECSPSKMRSVRNGTVFYLRWLVFDPWPLSKIVFHLKLIQRKTLNFVIRLPDVENITKWLDSILT